MQFLGSQNRFICWLAMLPKGLPRKAMTRMNVIDEATSPRAGFAGQDSLPIHDDKLVKCEIYFSSASKRWATHKSRTSAC